MIVYRRSFDVAASLVISLYSKKRDRNGNPVGETKEPDNIRFQRLELENQLAALEGQIQSPWQVQKGYHLLRNRIPYKTVPKATLEELIKAEVYETLDAPYEKFEEIY